MDKTELEKIFKFFGDEKDSKKIASKIIKNRKKKKIDTQDVTQTDTKGKSMSEEIIGEEVTTPSGLKYIDEVIAYFVL